MIPAYAAAIAGSEKLAVWRNGTTPKPTGKRTEPSVGSSLPESPSSRPQARRKRRAEVRHDPPLPLEHPRFARSCPVASSVKRRSLPAGSYSRRCLKWKGSRKRPLWRMDVDRVKRILTAEHRRNRSTAGKPPELCQVARHRSSSQLCATWIALWPATLVLHAAVLRPSSCDTCVCRTSIGVGWLRHALPPEQARVSSALWYSTFIIAASRPGGDGLHHRKPPLLINSRQRNHGHDRLQEHPEQAHPGTRPRASRHRRPVITGITTFIYRSDNYPLPSRVVAASLARGDLT